MKQEELSKINEVGWNQAAYQAWVNCHGSPSSYSQLLTENPTKTVNHYLGYMGDVKGKKIINLLGSKGNKAVSLALLGASVTVVDISEGNRQYASELAHAAGVNLNYVVSDVLNLLSQDQVKLGDFDFVLLELGVLHYFVDLNPLFEIVFKLLRPGGKFVLRDYHPFVSKLINIVDNIVVANGNYFDQEVKQVEVAYSLLLTEAERKKLVKNSIRRWGLGEIVTSIITAGLTMESLEEEAGIRWAFPENSPDDIKENIPGLFTILAKK
ncbi:class I SAM-dependent methyltransferase [Bacillus sp. CHD6a]|uniref:class I SAM-dependent methyltransferase n=1 Tax=Bacillus sp. CHD6a TaxID=1643452 RepID=UPI0006CD583D|nr:class I SAM-dependent methyltransferase [Bacillus sp. CHD6a]KPB06269.1 methyltransferase [Bacillus sp. CHD6a]